MVVKITRVRCYNRNKPKNTAHEGDNERGKTQTSERKSKTASENYPTTEENTERTTEIDAYGKKVTERNATADRLRNEYMLVGSCNVSFSTYI